MRTEQEIQELLAVLEASANMYEDAYEENFVAINTLRWILGSPPIADERRRDDD